MACQSQFQKTVYSGVSNYVYNLKIDKHVGMLVFEGAGPARENAIEMPVAGKASSKKILMVFHAVNRC